MKKNFLKFITVFVFCFSLASLASAVEITTNDPNGNGSIFVGQNLEIDCIDGAGVNPFYHMFIESIDGETLTPYTNKGGVNGSVCGTPATLNGSSFFDVENSSVVMALCDKNVVGQTCLEDNNWAELEADAGYITSISVNVLPAEIEPTPSPYASGIFYGRDDESGDSNASLLTASVGTATGATFGSLGPVVAVVGGILFAFIAIRWIVSLVYETDNKKGNKKV